MLLKNKNKKKTYLQKVSRLETPEVDLEFYSIIPIFHDFANQFIPNDCVFLF